MVCAIGVYIMTTRRLSVSRGVGFRTLLLTTLAFGCSSSVTKNNPAGNGDGGDTATGGTTGAAGGDSSNRGTQSSAGGNLGATGGSVSVETGGTVSNTGGDSTTGTGASTTVDCNPPVATQCTGTTPPAALIADFSIATGSTGPAVFGPWGQSVYGGAYIYPRAITTPGPCDETPSSYPVTQNLTGGNWNIQGTVGTYSGGGLWWNCNTGTTAKPNYVPSCTIDASAYTGISFAVSGNAGPAVSPATTGSFFLSVSTPSTMKPALDSAGNPKSCGTCTATTCGSSVSVPVSAAATTVKLTWAQLGVTTPNAISGIAFSLTDPCSLNGGYAVTPCNPTTFPVDMTIDDLQFTTD
jgi:hypothetical protein